MPFLTPFLFGSPTKIDKTEKNIGSQLILTSQILDLGRQLTAPPSASEPGDWIQLGSCGFVVSRSMQMKDAP